jgi:SNARE protein
MDNGAIAILKDNKQQCDTLKERISKNVERYDKVDKVEQGKLNVTIINDLTNFKSLIQTMNLEIKSLNNDQLEKTYKDVITVYKQDQKSLEAAFQDKKNNAAGLDNLIITEKQKKPNEMGSVELMQAGDKILKDDAIKVQNIGKEARKQLDIGREINKDLEEQKNKLDNIEGDLKEIDYSLKRASKQLAVMFRMYATDKIILILIVLVVLVIVGIIIASAVGATPEGKFNVPHDIFKVSNKTLL